MTKRTKRYGGFRIGDRVRVKPTANTSCKGSGRVMGYNGGKIVVESYPMKGMIYEFMPNQLINLTRQEECEKNKEELDKFTRKYFNQSADEYLKEDMEITKKLIEEFCKSPKEVPPFDWGVKLEAFEIPSLKDIFGENYEFEQDGEIGDLLPSPYNRDVYTSTKDYD